MFAKNTTNKIILPKVSEVLVTSKLDRIDSELFLAEILDLSPTEFFMNPGLEVSENDLERFYEFEKMRLAGKSVAVILGRKEFFGLEFQVDENVLIPRPETELLVEEILKIKPKSLLEVGTGSGCIAIAVKKNLPDCEVWASDISPKALEVARKNSENLKTEIKFIESDLLEKISGEFELIAANLPYVPENSQEVEIGVRKFEPDLALFSGRDGLDLIRKLLTQISKLPQKPKFILLEFGGVVQTEILRKFAQELFPNSEIEIKNDLAGISRIIKLRL